MGLRFHTTRHAAARASERDLSFEDLKSVVNYPTTKERQGQGGHGGTLFRFRKCVDGRTLVCVAEVRNGDCWIATGFYET